MRCAHRTQAECGQCAIASQQHVTPPEEAWQEGGCGGWGEEAGEPLHLLGLPDVVAFGDIGRRAQEGGEGSACECTDLYVTPDEMSSGSSHFY